MNILLSSVFREKNPEFRGAAVHAYVRNSEHNAELWKYIELFTKEYRARYTTDSIKDISAIQSVRQAYKRCGKDPSRYRPSSEALCRRLLKGQDLYRVNTLVDLINVVSIDCGHSVGGFDAGKIVGDTLTLGIGEEGEPYEGIGRGVLNIAGLPVYRDAEGGIGTPTSDHERTKLDLDTTELLAIVNAYDGKGLERSTDFMRELLCKYADGQQIDITYF